jgi:hypothetical protein
MTVVPLWVMMKPPAQALYIAVFLHDKSGILTLCEHLVGHLKSNTRCLRRNFHFFTLVRCLG